MVKLLLSVNPQMRPTAEQILKLPMIQKKLEKLFPEETSNNQSILLETIKNMKDLQNLKKKLPKPMFEQEQSEYQDTTYIDKPPTQRSKKVSTAAKMNRNQSELVIPKGNQ